MCFVVFYTVACLALLKSSSGVCKLKQRELQINLQDRGAHSVGSKLRGLFLHTFKYTLTSYDSNTHIYAVAIHAIYVRASLHKAGQI